MVFLITLMCTRANWMLLAQCVSVRSGCVDTECVVFCLRWWAFATHWIPVLRERRACRREKEEEHGTGFCCVEGCAVLRQCSVLSLLSWCCDCTVLLLCWGWDCVLLCRGLRLMWSVPLGVCPKVCKLCNLASVLLNKRKEMSTSVSCHHLAASVLG